MKTIIKVSNLVKRYGELEAVKGISFEVYQGEIFGLLGPNGAGKTTTLEIIETLREKTSGEVQVDGMSIDTDKQGIKQTLINKPKIVFLDEPTTGLDPQARRNLWELIREIRDKGATVVLTTHYMDEAENLCDRVAIIDSGRIISIDTPDRLIDHLVASGFERAKEIKKASLEDVFLNLTGKEWKDE